MTRIGILGGGFGLYGYLAALREVTDRPVLLPARYRERLAQRPELRGFADGVSWAEDDAEIIARSSVVIVARRPEDQVALAPLLAASPGIEAVLLEKPLAPTPASAAEVLATLRDAGKVVRIGFSFNSVGWAEALRNALATNPAPVAIDWRFNAHHYATGNTATWKRRVGAGGGALRFYGIQLLGLLAELGYTGCAASATVAEAALWRARFSGPGLPDCAVLVDSRSDTTGFSVRAGDLTVAELRDPFDEVVRVPGQDRRVAVLAGILESLLAGTPRVLPWYPYVNVLWAAAEERL